MISTTDNFPSGPTVAVTQSLSAPAEPQDNCMGTNVGSEASRSQNKALAGGSKELPARNLIFDVPARDAREFARLPWAVQQEVQALLKMFKAIADAKKKAPLIKRFAAHLNGQGRRGYSAPRLTAKFYAFVREGGDWRSLVNKAKAPEDTEKLPGAFIEFWKKLCEDNQRVTSEAYRELLTIWRTHYATDGTHYKAIAGYDCWPLAEEGASHPQGWGKRNLYRYTPDAVELAAARIGIQTASGVGLKLRFGRVGLKPFQFVQCDDHEFDARINFPGQLQSYRPRCFGAAEVLTSCLFHLAMKPTLWDIADQSKIGLSQKHDAMWFFVSLFTDHGFRLDTGTTALIEHGTTTVSAELEKLFYDCSGGKISFQRSGRYHHAAHGGQFAPKSGGNPRFKAIIEGYWRLLNDRLAALPGQVGMDRLHAPEENGRAEAYNSKLLKAATSFPVEQAANLILPRLTWDEFCRFVFEKWDAINSDTQHKIKQWEKCGFLLKEWRADFNAAWETETKLLELTTEQRQAVVAVLTQNDSLVRVRRMSRWEAFRKHAGELHRLDHATIPALVGQSNALRGGDPLTVRNGVFEFEDWRIAPDALVYLAVDEKGNRLREGEKFIGFCNPMSPGALIACDARLRVVAICPPMLQPTPGVDDIRPALGLKKSWWSRALASQQARHAPDAEALKFMKAHNERVLAGAPVTRAAQTALEQRNAEEITADDAIDTLFTNQPTTEP